MTSDYADIGMLYTILIQVLESWRMGCGHSLLFFVGILHHVIKAKMMMIMMNLNVNAGSGA